ncbi:flagellin N-terminal helical domain-containing protein [Savagea faecisuis]|uniref:Flagellin n=1 Tax=Savagea faecisuis TaxID=1274803 RepID=A0ABW3H1R5_9BACL
MIIRGNGLAILNQLKRTEKATRQTFGTLSSGKRITKAADDAAGLAISEKLRGVMRGSLQAVRNIQDAQSLLATADGAMMEMSEIVQRMRELTIQAMNAPLTDVHTGADSDTAIIQKEIDALKQNLRDIVKHTEFNTRPILTGAAQGFITEELDMSSTIRLTNGRNEQPIEQVGNLVGEQNISLITESEEMKGLSSLPIKDRPHTSNTEKLTTVDEGFPRFTADGQTLIFQSTRDGKDYERPLGGDVIEKKSQPVNQRTSVGKYTLRSEGGLHIRYTEAGKTKRISIPDALAGTGNYTFSPMSNADGSVTFAYRDENFNISTRTFNPQTLEVSAPVSVIPSNDRLNLPPKQNKIQLSQTPKLYEMNKEAASLKVYKQTDSGKGEPLLYWDGQGAEPEGGYTVKGNIIEFFGTARIGGMPEDDAQDYYQISYVNDNQPSNDFFQYSLSSVHNFYNIHGEEGPMSLKLTVGDKEVPREAFLENRPTNPAEANGVYIDSQTKTAYLYGTYRPAAGQSVNVNAIQDDDDQPDVHTEQARIGIPTYNLTDSDLTTERALRVFVGGKEISWGEQDGYTYEQKTGKVRLYGNARPDLLKGEKVNVLFIEQKTEIVNPDRYDIQLKKRPQIYELQNQERASIYIQTDTGRIIPYDEEKKNGYWYNKDTNRIELYGDARPRVKAGKNSSDGVHERYDIQYVYLLEDTKYDDGVVEVEFKQQYAELYSLNEDDKIETIELLVDGKKVPYDPEGKNGFLYDKTSGKLKIYGDYRPKAEQIGKTPSITYRYVQEQSLSTIENGTYDLNLPSDSAIYGVENGTEPRAIRVYGPDGEIHYDEMNGFILNENTKQIQLTGNARPIGSHNKDDFKVYTISTDALSQSVPVGSHITSVVKDGQVLQEVTDENETGYIRKGGRIYLTGDARPNVKESQDKVAWQVDYFALQPIELSTEAKDDEGAYCDHEIGHALPKGEILPESVEVIWNGKVLTKDQFTFDGTRVHLRYETLTFETLNNEASVNYTLRREADAEDNHFIFQVGPNENHHVNATIAACDKVLHMLSPICVLEYNHAAQALTRVDEALNWVSAQLGNIGALTNRLEHTDANVQVAAEQLMSALSRIEDVDMAKAKMEEVKLSILQQAQQIALVQHNTTQSEVLQLLK